MLADTLKPYTNEEFLLAIESLRVFARERKQHVRHRRRRRVTLNP